MLQKRIYRQHSIYKVLFFLSLCISSSALHSQAFLDDARQRLFQEDFKGAFEALNTLEDSPEKSAFQELVYECELASIHEQAQALITQKSYQEAHELLSLSLTKELGGRSAIESSSGPQLQGLLSLVESILHNAQLRADNPRKDFLDGFDEADTQDQKALDNHHQNKETLQQEIEQILTATEVEFQAGLELLTQKNTSKEQKKNAEAAFESILEELTKAQERMDQLKDVLEPAEYAAEERRRASKLAELLQTTCLEFGKLLYQQERTHEAIKIVEQGLSANPFHLELLDLRLKLED